MYANVRRVFLLASKPEHPLAILPGTDWTVLRTTAAAISRGADGIASDLLEITHYVEKVEACPKPYPSCGRCHGAGAMGGWQGFCPQCGGKGLTSLTHKET